MIDTSMPDTLSVNEKEYEIIELLGKGKGGYSYLASDGKQRYVLKQIHHEPCSYYQFGNKIQAEINDYVLIDLTQQVTISCNSPKYRTASMR